MPLDIDALRADTPGCASVVHLNHAGSSPMPQPVVDAVVEHTLLQAQVGSYEAADATAERREGVYRSIARLVGGEPSDVAPIEKPPAPGTWPSTPSPSSPGDRILTSVAEHHSNVVAVLQVRHRGVVTEVVPNDEHGQLDVAALTELLDDRVRLVAVSHMPTNGGPRPARRRDRGSPPWLPCPLPARRVPDRRPAPDRRP